MALTVQLCLVLVSSWLAQTCGSTSGDILAAARSDLRAGAYEEAVDKISLVIGKDPTNLVAYDLRATVYQAVGRTKSALADLQKAVEIDPKRKKAWVKKAGLEIRLGQLGEAEKSLKNTKEDDEHDAVMEILQFVQATKAEAVRLYKAKQYGQAVAHLTQLIEHTKEDEDVRVMRAEANVKLGNMAEAIGDYLRATKMSNDNTVGYLRLSQLYYQNGEADGSLTQIRECLKLDPEHKECFAHYKKVKKLAKQVGKSQQAMEDGNYEDAVDSLQAALQSTRDSRTFQMQLLQDLCHCNLKLKRGQDSVSACTLAHEMAPTNTDILCDRAEAYILENKLDAALDDYHKALKYDEDSHRAREGVAKVQKLQKQARKRDYYAILGVRRDATKKQITKAYRKLALEWHPDKYDGEDKAVAEKKFMDISDAKEVLMDEEKRQQFDAGIDPLDPEQQQEQRHQYGHPFHPFFQQGGGGQTFHFHF